MFYGLRLRETFGFASARSQPSVASDMAKQLGLFGASFVPTEPEAKKKAREAARDEEALDPAADEAGPVKRQRTAADEAAPVKRKRPAADKATPGKRQRTCTSQTRRQETVDAKAGETAADTKAADGTAADEKAADGTAAAAPTPIGLGVAEEPSSDDAPTPLRPSRDDGVAKEAAKAEEVATGPARELAECLVVPPDTDAMMQSDWWSSLCSSVGASSSVRPASLAIAIPLCGMCFAISVRSPSIFWLRGVG